MIKVQRELLSCIVIELRMTGVQRGLVYSNIAQYDQSTEGVIV